MINYHPLNSMLIQIMLIKTRIQISPFITNSIKIQYNFSPNIEINYLIWGIMIKTKRGETTYCLNNCVNLREKEM